MLALLSRNSATRRIELDRLSRPEVLQLAEAVRGTPLPAGEGDRLFDRSEGNPLVGQELLQVQDAAASPSSLDEVLLARARRADSAGTARRSSGWLP